MASKLFIVGIPRMMEEITLVELFSAHGQVDSVTIITDQQSGKSLGYGFLTMTDQAGAERAIAALDGTMLDGRTISVRIAENKASEVKRHSTKNHPPRPASAFPATPQPAPFVKKKRPRRPLP